MTTPTFAELNDAGSYSPDQIAFWHRGSSCREGRCNWTMLESAVEGGTGCTGMGSGRGERFGLAHMKADLERAADELPIYWQVTRLIFSRQHRYSVYLKRWTAAGSPHEGSIGEPAEMSAAFELAVWRMSTTLGWDAAQAA